MVELKVKQTAVALNRGLPISALCLITSLVVGCANNSGEVATIKNQAPPLASQASETIVAEAQTEATEASEIEPVVEDVEVVEEEEPVSPTFALTPKRLVLAARYGQDNVLQYLLDNEVPVNGQDAYGDTALIAAAANGHSEMVQHLLELGADIDKANEQSHTALMAVAVRGDDKLLNELIKAGATIDLTNNQGETALFLAVQQGHFDAVTSLLKAGADPNIKNTIRANERNSGYTPLMYAASHGLTLNEVDWTKMVKLLLANSADPNIKDSRGGSALVATRVIEDPFIEATLLEAGAKDEQMYAGLDMDDALVKAARLGDIDKVRSLIVNGANVNYMSNKGFTPLLAAAFEGHLNVVQAITEAGVELDFVPQGLRQFAMSNSRAPMKDKELMAAASRGDTGLVISARHGFVDVARYILEQGAKIDQPNRLGETALFIAAKQGDGELTSLLLEYGEDPNAKVLDNRTNQFAIARNAMGRDSMLIVAAQNGSDEVAQKLIDAGADINYRGFLGKTALHNAVGNGRMKTVVTLLEKGADPTIASQGGLTPLMDAARIGNQRMIEQLIVHGANVNAIERPELGFANKGEGSSGMTPLMFAARGGHAAAVELLLSNGAEPSVRNADGKRAFNEAEDNGYDNVANILRAGAAPEEAVTLFKYQE